MYILMITPYHDTGSGLKDRVFVFYKSSADWLYLIPHGDSILGAIEGYTKL
jgi:hypothetical protein